MARPLTAISDKVTRMVRSIVYLAMKSQPAHGVSSDELSRFINKRSALDRFHAGMVELALQELHSDGVVKRAGVRWYVPGVTT